MSEDIDTNMDSGGDVAGESEMPDVGAMRDARIAREGEQDKKLDATVRKAAREAYSRDDPDAVATSRQSMDATVRQAAARIAARDVPPSMPLRPGATVDQAVDAAVSWAELSRADQRGLADKMDQIANMREAAKALGLELSDADVLKLVQDADAKKTLRHLRPRLVRSGRSWASGRRIAQAMTPPLSS